MPCDYSKYPPNWKAISARIKEREKNRCKFCGFRHYGVFQTHEDGRRRYAYGTIYYDDFQYTGSYKEAREAADHLNDCIEPWGGWSKYKVNVLTVAHLDHDVSNNADTNLAALCNRCHLRHDAKLHGANSAETRRKKAGQPALIPTD